MHFSQVVLLSTLYSAVGLFVLVLAAGKDYYKTLGVSKTASDRDIKRAFRKLAVQYHPDKNSEKGAEAKFREIAEAYEVLGDAKKRQQYDQFGGDFEQRTGGGGGHPDFGFNFDDFFSKFDQSFKDHQKGHQRAHQRAHQQAHERASGFKFNLFDDLWDDDDDIGGFGNFEFPSFDDSLFDFGGGFFSGGADVHMHQAHSSGGSGQRCSTVTQKIGNTVTTFTQCS